MGATIKVLSAILMATGEMKQPAEKVEIRCQTSLEALIAENRELIEKVKFLIETDRKKWKKK